MSLISAGSISLDSTFKLLKYRFGIRDPKVTYSGSRYPGSKTDPGSGVKNGSRIRIRNTVKKLPDFERVFFFTQNSVNVIQKS
jgi:hypothetical protein